MSKDKLIQQKTSYDRIKPESNKPYTRIYLVRHGHPDYSLMQELGDQYMPLSDVGRKQRALLVSKKLSTIEVDFIYASEFRRAQETAELYANKVKKEIIIDERLNEINWKDWYKIKYFNMTEKTRIKRVTKYKKMEEELNKFQTESRRFLADIYHKHKGQGVILFCHGNIIRAMITSILNSDVIGFLSMEIYQSSVSKLVIDKDGYVKINYINSIRHLPKRPDEDLFKLAME